MGVRGYDEVGAPYEFGFGARDDRRVGAREVGPVVEPQVDQITAGDEGCVERRDRVGDEDDRVRGAVTGESGATLQLGYHPGPVEEARAGVGVPGQDDGMDDRVRASSAGRGVHGRRR